MREPTFRGLFGEPGAQTGSMMERFIGTTAGSLLRKHSIESGHSREMQTGLAPEPSRMGTVRVLMVEDDVEQIRTLKALFALANEKNEGIVTFEVNGMFSPRAILK